MNSLNEKIFNCIEILSVAVKEASESSDLADRLSLKGNIFEGFIHWVTTSLNGLPEGNYFSLIIDGEKFSGKADLSNLKKYKDDHIDSWELTLNKNSFFESLERSKGSYFFFSYQSLRSWLEKVDVLFIDSFPEGIEGVKIFLWEAESSFGGPKFQILSPKDYLEPDHKWPEVRLPAIEAIRSQVHVMADKVLLRPDFFLITKLSQNTNVNEILIKNCFLHFSIFSIQQTTSH